MQTDLAGQQRKGISGGVRQSLTLAAVTA